MNTLAGAFLGLLAVIMWDNWTRGTLGDWFAAKFFNRAPAARPRPGMPARALTDPAGLMAEIGVTEAQAREAKAMCIQKYGEANTAEVARCFESTLRGMKAKTPTAPPATPANRQPNFGVPG